MSFLNEDSKYKLFLTNIENEKKFENELNNIYKVILRDSFKNILNIPKIDFMNKLSKDVNSILVEQYSNKISENQKLESMINECSNKYEKKYDKYYEDLSSQWNKYFHQKTNIKKKENKENILSSFYFKNFIKHCARTGEYALHLCDKNKKKGKFIIIYEKKNESNKLKYIICEKCRKAYFIKTFKNYCDYCNIKYYSSVLNKNGNNTNNNLFYATVYPSHCNVLFNKIITCPKCYKKLYIDIKENKLICLNENCNYVHENPDRIEWECNKCEIYYIARVIIYNEIELIHFDDMIKKALILKKLAHPKKTCCINKDNISSVQFYHNKKCRGILYFFEENKKLFLVCEKCKAINYFTKFIWTCPFCGLYYREINSEQNELKLILSDRRRGNRIEDISRNKHNLFDYINNNNRCYRSIEFINTNNSKESKNSKKEIKMNKLSMSNLLLNNNTLNRVNSIEKLYNLKLKNISTDFSTSFLETYNENNLKREASQNKRSGLCRKIMHDLIRPLDERTYSSVDKRILRHNLSNLNVVNNQNSINNINNNINNNLNIINKNSSSSYEKRIVQYNNRPINNLKINIKLIGTNNNLNDKQWYFSNYNNKMNKLKTDIDLSAYQTISSISQNGIKTETANNINNININSDSHRNIYIPNENSIYNKRNNKNQNNVTNLIYKNKKILPIKEGNNYMVYKKNFILKDKDKQRNEKAKYEEKKIHNIHDQNKNLYRKYLRNKNSHVYYSNNNGFLNNISTNKIKDICNSVERMNHKKLDYSVSTKVDLSNREANNKRENKNNEDIYIEKYTKRNKNNVYNIVSNSLTSYKKKKYNALIINGKDKRKEENNKTIDNNKKIDNNKRSENKKEILNRINNNNKKELEKIKSYRELEKIKVNINNNITKKGNNERNQNKNNHAKKSIKEIKGLNNNRSNGRLKKYFLINEQNNSIYNNRSKESKEKKNKEESKNKNKSKSKSKGKEEKNNKIEKKISFDDDDDDDFIEATLSSAIKIEDEKIKMDKKLYDTIKMRLISIVSRSNLPLFDVDSYLIWNKIGDGSNGEIFEISDTNTYKKYALKKLNTDNLSSLESMINEFQIIYQNKHKYILKIYGICVRCLHNNWYNLYVLMDLALTDWEEEIVDRQRKRKFYTEKELVTILKQLVSALVYLQKEKSVSHRDIKCENILIFKNFVYKLCDFGEAKQKVERNIRKTLRGTDFYMSPLLYNGLINHENYVKHNPYKSDVFSLGFCLIISAALNFGIIDEIRKLNSEEKMKQVLVNYFNKRYSDDFIYLMLKMITIDEKNRPDFIELNRIIQNYYSFDIN